MRKQTAQIRRIRDYRQLPIEHWHDNISEATVSDAILDRLLHGAHRLELIGDSTQKTLIKNLIRKLQKLSDRDRLRYVLTTSVELSVTFR